MITIPPRKKKTCPVCQAEVIGRYDKIFCTVQCKSRYHVHLINITKTAAKSIDKILKRNRSILLEVMGKSTKQKKVLRTVLDGKKFNWTYYTHQHVNVKKKTFYYVYDFAWMVFSDQEVLIKKV